MTKPKDSPFAALEKLRADLPAGAPPAAAPAPPAKPEKKGPARAVVRMERKGRGGKEATVIEKLDLPRPHLERWCKDLKSALGCGGAVEDTTIVLQGDLRARLPALLTARGVGKVTVG